MAPTNIVFDVGNVLVQWNPHRLYRTLFANDAAIDAFLAEIGFHAWNLEQDRGRAFAEGEDLLAAQFPHHATAIRAYRPGFNETIGGPIEGTVAVLADLREAGVPLYAITNFHQDTFRETKERFPFLGWFRDVVVSGEEKLLKPDPEIYRVLLRRNGLAADECLFIDDSAANVAGAEAVGMKAVRFTSPEQLRKTLAPHLVAAA